MKRMQTITWVVIGAIVLLTALGVGFYIKEAGQKNKVIEPNTSDETGGSLTADSPKTGREKFHNLSEEERANLTEERNKRAGRWVDMSEEEKEKFRELLRRRANAIRQSKSEELPGVSEEKKTALREKWANMSEQEREEFRAKLRERLGTTQQDTNAVPGEPNVVGQEPNAVRQEKK